MAEIDGGIGHSAVIVRLGIIILDAKKALNRYLIREAGKGYTQNPRNCDIEACAYGTKQVQKSKSVV